MTFGDLIVAIESGARLMRRFEPRWPGDTPRDRYFLERDNRRTELQRPLLRRVFRSGRFESAAGDGIAAAELRLKQPRNNTPRDI